MDDSGLWAVGAELKVTLLFVFVPHKMPEAALRGLNHHPPQASP
jgi:hypothetical protein